MKARIRFAVGSTALVKTVNVDGVSFRDFALQMERNHRRDTIVHFNGDDGESFSLAARSVVLMEEVPS